VLIECRTYRLSGHSRGDRREYRARAEETQAWENEPIARFEAFLKQAKLLDDPAIEVRRAAAAGRIEAAIRFAEASPDPDPATVCEGVYA
jgi:pyruvate dehydrogenase E1 component alpha subunit